MSRKPEVHIIRYENTEKRTTEQQEIEDLDRERNLRNMDQVIINFRRFIFWREDRIAIGLKYKRGQCSERKSGRI